ncbi:MAG: hypothetical protein COA57_14395 [Flavobacteriales bacterium]|nr:MAG: hypothetical protein COA57_14395 [Flavobacteriales bacterium]
MWLYNGGGEILPAYSLIELYHALQRPFHQQEMFFRFTPKRSAGSGWLQPLFLLAFMMRSPSVFIVFHLTFSQNTVYNIFLKQKKTSAIL